MTRTGCDRQTLDTRFKALIKRLLRVQTPVTNDVKLPRFDQWPDHFDDQARGRFPSVLATCHRIATNRRPKTEPFALIHTVYDGSMLEFLSRGERFKVDTFNVTR